MTEHLSKTRVSREELLQAYQFTRTILDSMHDGIAIIDAATHRILGVNRVFLQEAGTSEEEVIGQHCHEVLHRRGHICTPSDENCPISAMLDSGEHRSVEHVHYDQEGKAHTVEVSVSPIRDHTGKILQFVHITRDMSERKKTDEALRASEEKFSRMFMSIPDSITINTAADGRFVDVNDSFLKLTGYEREEVMGQTWAGLGIRVTEDSTSRTGLTPEQQRVFSLERKIRRKSGEMLTVLLSEEIMELGGSDYCISIMHDITRRNAVEEELLTAQAELENRHSELSSLFQQVEKGKRQWEQTMDCIDDLVMLTDSEGRIIRCNNAVRQMAGDSYAGVLGRYWQELFLDWRIEDCSPDGTGVELFHESTNRWFSVNSYPYQDTANNEVAGHVVTARDSTQFKLLAQSLEITNAAIDSDRQVLQDTVDQLSVLIQRVMENGDLSPRFHNPALEKCYEKMQCGKEDCPCYGKGPMRCWQIAGTYCGDKVNGMFANKFGNCRDCEVYQSSMSATSYQIGEHFNNMMQMLLDKQNELQSAYEELAMAQSQILQQEKMALVGQLAAGVAHEINNPTGFIMSNLGTLKKYIDRLTDFLGTQSEGLSVDPAVREKILSLRKALKVDFILADAPSLIAESIDGAERVKKIVQDLKGFSRVDEAEWKMADVNEGLESTLNIVWNELKYKAKVTKDYGQLPLIKCNPGQLNQVFMNLLVNAAHAIEKQGEIVIRTSCEGKTITILVSDTGCGIPPDKVRRIFEPFYTTKPVGSGTGLGLSIAYDIVKKHEGDIVVRSEVGVGTAFIITIPVVEAK